MRRRVLLIDDDAEFRELVHQLLDALGVEVVALAEPPPDVDALILDLSFEPGDLSGWSLLQRIRDDPLTKAIPVLLCTAAAEEVDGQEAWLAEHRVGLLIKPFSLAQLEEKLASVLGEPVSDER
jgi:CheY-like chemotaxis protein